MMDTGELLARPYPFSTDLPKHGMNPLISPATSGRISKALIMVQRIVKRLQDPALV
jgi:hypothetical protein